MSGGPLRAAVIGVGRIGRLHAQIYAQDPRTKLVGVTDIDSAAAKSVAEGFGGCAYPDVATLLREATPDFVTIAVPEEHRLAPAVAVAESGAHIFLEKPLSPTVQRSTELVDALSGVESTVMVNFILRSDPRYLHVKDLTANGTLGELCTISAFRRGTSAGAEAIGSWTGLLISTAIHDLDAMTWIAGAPVERVYAEAVVKRSAQWGREDAVLATLRFANGVIGALDTSWVMPPSAPQPLWAGLQLVGTGGAAAVDGSNFGVSVLTDAGYELPDFAHWPVGRDGVGGSLKASVSHFIDCLVTGAKPVMSMADALAAEKVVAAIREAARTGQSQSMT